MAPRIFSLKQIEALQAIARAGSLVGAAQILNMTPAAMTARVKGLEDSLGLLLFDRTSNGLRVSSAGEIALAAAEKIERAVRDFGDTMEAVRTGRGGRLAVAAVSTAKYFTPRLIAAFVQQYPGIELRFLIGNRTETMASLRNSDVDVALMGRPPADLRVSQIAIGPHPYVMIAAPAHPLVERRAIEKTELAGETFLFREEGSGSRSLFDYFVGDIAVQRSQLGIELGSNETIKQAVMAGLGVAFISAHTIAAEVADGRLACLDIVGLPIIRQWYVVHRTDRELSPTAQLFRDFTELRCAHFLPQLGTRKSTA
ncbi:DNA-binding transcriptional LysR family regulator [Rhodoligotrophos appendicifer]|uniref:LysR family transcriptional regulator n=1 Tax=Rhodoligotrophos appendicifer TaxID=987056 RepID=UPI001185E599|nr:LysR family transcriptional regulator [Rhodoligotrophos appendicifer]